MLRHPRHVMTLLRRRAVAGLALCLALLGALAPTVSHALNWARGGNAGLIEVCTSAGPRWMALPAITQQADSTRIERAQTGDSPSALALWPEDPMSAAVLDHCPFCLLMADRAAPPPQVWQLALVKAGASAAPTIPWVYFYPVFSALIPPPRGPPELF